MRDAASNVFKLSFKLSSIITKQNRRKSSILYCYNIITLRNYKLINFIKIILSIRPNLSLIALQDLLRPYLIAPKILNIEGQYLDFI